MTMCARISATAGSLVRGPRNTVVVSGATATFTCATGLNIDRLCWERYVREGNKPIWITVCNTLACRSRYSVHTSVDTRFRQHSLTIDSCNATDSIRYRCGECESRPGKQTARLVVIGIVFTLLFNAIFRIIVLLSA